MNANTFLTVIAISASLLGLIGCGGPAEKFICGDCGAEFDSQEELDAHMEEAHPPEPPDEPVTLSDEAMGMTGLTLPTMYRWVTSREGRCRTVHAFRHGHYLGSGQAHKVFEEAELHGDGQWKAVKEYADWMAKK